MTDALGPLHNASCGELGSIAPRIGRRGSYGQAPWNRLVGSEGERNLAIGSGGHALAADELCAFILAPGVGEELQHEGIARGAVEESLYDCLTASGSGRG